MLCEGPVLSATRNMEQRTVWVNQPQWFRGRVLRDNRGRLVPVQGAGRVMLDRRVRRAGASVVVATRRGDPAWRRAAIRDGIRHGAVLAIGTGLIVWGCFAMLELRWAMFAVVLPLIGLMGLSHLWFLSPELGRQLIVFRINVGECPACCYSLSGLVVEQDGCVVCPECAGAWRLGDGPESTGR